MKQQISFKFTKTNAPPQHRHQQFSKISNSIYFLTFFNCFDIHSFPTFISLLALFLVYQIRAMSYNQSGQCELRPGKQ